MDWDQAIQKRFHSRVVVFRISAFYNDEKFLRDLLSQKPDAQIIRVLSHTEDKNSTPVYKGKEIYLDEFGLPVFISSIIDWDGELTDIDERFSGTTLFPNDL
jgi:hypothetical protein